MDWDERVLSTLPARRLGVFAAILSLVFLIQCTPSRGSATDVRIKVMTYNIHHAEGTDGHVNVKRIADLIRDSGADVVALQEVDRGVERTNKIDIMTMLSDLTGMTYAFGKNIEFQGGDYGNGFLTRFPILAEKNLQYHMINPGEQRGLLQVVLEIRGVEVVFMNTHLDYREADTERRMNVEEIKSAANEFGPRSVVVCGDFNDLPSSRTIESMKQQFTDVGGLADVGEGNTYPTSEPVKRIDYIFVSKTAVKSGDPRAFELLKPRTAKVLKSDGSDHLPFFAEFELQ